jgi:hypothetical protein
MSVKTVRYAMCERAPPSLPRGGVFLTCSSEEVLGLKCTYALDSE